MPAGDGRECATVGCVEGSWRLAGPGVAVASLAMALPSALWLGMGPAVLPGVGVAAHRTGSPKVLETLDRSKSAPLHNSPTPRGVRTQSGPAGPAGPARGARMSDEGSFRRRKGIHSAAPSLVGPRAAFVRLPPPPRPREATSACVVAAASLGGGCCCGGGGGGCSPCKSQRSRRRAAPLSRPSLESPLPDLGE